MSFAVVPAAGRASRLGRSKALLPLGLPLGLPLEESRLVDVLLDRLARGGVDRVVVVAAAGDRPLAEHCARHRLRLAVNERPERGMLSSIEAGLESLAAEASPTDTVLICPVDFPAIAPATVAALLAALSGTAAELAVPTCGGRRGHPLALRASLIGTLRSLDPAIGLRQLLALRPYLEVAVDDQAIHRDLDTWRDYAELVAALSRRRAQEAQAG